MKSSMQPAGRRVAPLVLAALALGLLSACSGLEARASGAKAGFPLAGEGAGFSSREMSAFARENLATFSTFSLSNGIPVVVKRTAANQVQHIELVLRGGSLLATAETAGYEGLALATAARASARYSHEAVSSVMDETSSWIGPTAGYEYSTYGLTTLGKYFDRLFPIWADTLVEPRFDSSDFDQVLSEAKLSLQGRDKDPWAKTGLVEAEAFFRGHPFAFSPEGTDASLGAATLTSVKSWYERYLSANRLFVVAVGDFDPARLETLLEKSLGSIPDREVVVPPAAPPFTPVPGLVKYEFPQSRGLAYLRGDFAAPAPRDSDYMPMNLAMRILSDLLFNVVRDKYGAVYSTDAYIRALGANYGSLTLFKTKSAGKVKAYVDEALADMSAGRAMSLTAAPPDPMSGGQTPTGGERMSIADALPIYKAQYINELYEKQQTNRAIAGLIAQSVITQGDYRSYLLDVDRINAVTADEVQAAFGRYILHGSIHWVALGSADALLPLTSVDFGAAATGQ